MLAEYINCGSRFLELSEVIIGKVLGYRCQTDYKKTPPIKMGIDIMPAMKRTY